MIRLLVQCYQMEGLLWEEMGNRLFSKCMDGVKDRLNKQFITAYYKSEGFHDWCARELKFLFCSGYPEISMTLQNNEDPKENITIVFEKCRNVSFTNLSNDYHLDSALLIMGFERHGLDFAAGLGYTDNSTLFFDFSTVSVKTANEQTRLS